MAERRRSFALLSLGAAACLAVLLGLGTWQVARKHEKDARIAQIEASRAAEPLAALPRDFDPALVHRRVRLSGRFLADKAARLYGRARDGRPGVEIVMPLVLDDGRAVLVNRGWLALDETGAGALAASDPAAFEGELGAGERPGALTPENRPLRGEWYYAHVPAMAEAAGVAASPYLVAALAPTGGRVRPRAGTALPPNNHLQYALTWYGLAAALVAVYAALALRRR